MSIILKQQHGRKRIMLIMINVDHLETAARQKKDNVDNDYVDYLETAARQKKVMLIMINVDHLQTAARNNKENVHND